MNRSPGIFVPKAETVLYVRRLKLQRRRKGHCGGVWRIWLLSNQKLKQLKNNNNIEVVTMVFRDSLLKQYKLYQNVVFGMINIRYIKREDEILSEMIKDKNLYALCD